VGADGVVVAVEDALASPGVPPKPPVAARVEIGTTCTLTSVFALGQDVWIVGASGGRGGVWRVRDKKVAEKWGEC
jgi:hypothetical protein